MKEYTVVRLLALLLALAVMLPSAAVAEALVVQNAAATGEDALGEEGVSDVGQTPLADPEAEATEPETPAEGEGEAPGGGEEITSTLSLVQTSLTLGVKEKYTLALQDGISPKSVGAKYTSSKAKVAAVNKTSGVVTAKKRGKASITMRAEDGTVSTCQVTVLAAPSKVKLSKSKLTLGAGEEYAVKATLPNKTASALCFSSSNRKVATVDAEGHIVALKKGTATITVKTFNNKKATCKVTVKAAPKSVSLPKDAISMWLGDGYDAKVTLSKNSAGSYALTSDNEAVVAVSGNRLTAVALGQANISVTTYNGKTATMAVEVLHRPVYRALLIGETYFPGTEFCDLPGKTDTTLMKNMLKSTQGATRSGWSVTTKMDRTAGQIRRDIQKAFSGAEEGDVSLFYISTHGDQGVDIGGDSSDLAGYLMTYPNYECTNWYERYTLTLGTLAQWLEEVPGQVVVIIDSCGSGAAVYGGDGIYSNASEGGLGGFNAAVVNAFAARDQGVMRNGMDTGAFVIQNKFFVLTSAAYREACFTDKGKYSYFTKWLTDGIATKGRMPADSNKNKLTTLNELYSYIKKRGDKQVIEFKGGLQFKQHVQVYPSDSGFELFYRK